MNDADRRKAEELARDSARMQRMWDEMEQVAYGVVPSKHWLGETPMLSAIKIAKQAAQEEEQPEILAFALRRWAGFAGFQALMQTIEFRALYQMLSLIEANHAP